MTRALLLLLVLAGCVPATQTGFSQGVTDIAVQRVRFTAEAVCLNNRSRASQDRAARALNYPVRERDGNITVYANPGTLTFIRLGPAPEQGFVDQDGQRRVIRGNGCSVGSPAVGVDRANRIVGEILTPRLVDGSSTLVTLIGAGTNESGGLGLFFADLSLTLPSARTTFTDPRTGEGIAFDHPVILIVHN